MEKIAVWFSCGVASAVAAKKTLEKYGETHEIRIVYNPVIEEDEDNLRFFKDVEAWLGVKIEIATNRKFPNASAKEVWAKKKYMSNKYGAPCTLELKKEARYQWEHCNTVDYHVLGFTADEKDRHRRFIQSERSNIIPVLIDEKITKDDCFKIIQDAGIRIPRIYTMGYPNANCIGCVKATSPTYWNHVRKMHPEVFADRAAQSRELGARLARHKGVRVFLDELPEDAYGYPLKKLKFDCGIFCEEK